MRKEVLVQILLTMLVLIILIFVYQKYFKKEFNENAAVIKEENTNEENNLINIVYESIDKEGRKYIITAETGNFKEEKPEDIERIKKLQLELHSDFINLVKSSRGSKLKDPEKNNIFTGEFWSGSTSLNLGLIDGLGNAEQILRKKFGENIEIKKFEKQKGFLAKRLSSSLDNQVDNIISTIEERALWQKFGL